MSDTKANDRQVGGDHYKTGGEEHWDRVNRLGLDYFQGQITKYVERWKKKGGVQDLKKARHFLDKYIEINEPDGTEPQGRGYVNQDQTLGIRLDPGQSVKLTPRDVDSNRQILFEGNLPPPRPSKGLI